MRIHATYVEEYFSICEADHHGNERTNVAVIAVKDVAVAGPQKHKLHAGRPCVVICFERNLCHSAILACF
jgi:hypothetical protein